MFLFSDQNQWGGKTYTHTITHTNKSRKQVQVQQSITYDQWTTKQSASLKMACKVKVFASRNHLISTNEFDTAYHSTLSNDHQ